jgi:hypothetical protein
MSWHAFLSFGTFEKISKVISENLTNLVKPELLLLQLSYDYGHVRGKPLPPFNGIF